MSFFTEANEYDAYLRPVITGLGHCHCWSGGYGLSPVQKREIPERPEMEQERDTPKPSKEEAPQDGLRIYIELGPTTVSKIFSKEVLDCLRKAL